VKHEGHEEIEDHEGVAFRSLRAFRSFRALRSLRALRVLLLSCALSTACGKKGPPLAPFQRIPATPEISSARRAGGEMYVSIKIPTMNVDGSAPAAIAQIEVYAVTALTSPPRAQFLSMATRVGAVPVAREADPSDKSGTIVPDPQTGALQGSTVTIRDALTTEAMEPKEVPPLPAARQVTTSVSDEPVPQILRRFYMTVAFSDRRRSSAPSMIVEVPLGSLPEQVPAVRASLMMGERLMLEWDPSGGLLGWLLERALPPEVAPTGEQPTPAAAAKAPSAELPAGPTTYNVYREIAPDPLVLPETASASPWATAPPEPINMTPLTVLTYTEELRIDERRRCYRVAAVRGIGAGHVESEPSERECIVPVDVEPPTTPTGLQALPLDGEIRLTWEPNGEEDLRGYVVLRRDSGGDTLQPLTPVPIFDTRFTDPKDNVIPGRMYTYVVRAVDNRIPLPNVSDPAEVTETAR
jgi:hypothetical protein